MTPGSYLQHRIRGQGLPARRGDYGCMAIIREAWCAPLPHISSTDLSIAGIILCNVEGQWVRQDLKVVICAMYTFLTEVPFSIIGNFNDNQSNMKGKEKTICNSVTKETF